MNSLPGPPPGLDLTDSKVPSLVTGFVLTWAFGLGCVALRLAARRLTKNELWWDDWLIVVSLLFTGGFMIDITCYMVPRGGFGKHIWAAPPNALAVYFKGLFIAEYLYTLSIMTVKWSMLAFYWRIFGFKSSNRVYIWIIVAIVSAWGFAVILVTSLQCRPISAFWGRFDPDMNLSPDSYTCGVDVQKFFIANAIPNMATDILMLLVPLPNIWSLKLRRPQKVALIGVFLLGLFITAVSVIRLYYVVKLDLSSVDSTWLFSDEMMWTGIEVNVATVCACLPSLKPLLNFALYGTIQGSSNRHTAGSHSGMVTIGNTKASRNRDGTMPLHSHTGTCTAEASFHGHHPEDTHPFTMSVETESSSWVDFKSQDVELDNFDKESNETQPGARTSNHVTVTKTIGVEFAYKDQE